MDYLSLTSRQSGAHAREGHSMLPCRSRWSVPRVGPVMRHPQRYCQSRQLRNVQQPAAFSPPALDAHADGTIRYTLILYTKQDCPLCEGLQQKLEAVVERAQFLPSILSQARVEIRDIMGTPAWEAAYKMSVPVLVRAELDGSNEVVLPRPAPRLGAEGLQRHLEKVLAEWDDS